MSKTKAEVLAENQTLAERLKALEAHTAALEETIATNSGVRIQVRKNTGADAVKYGLIALGKVTGAGEKARFTSKIVFRTLTQLDDTIAQLTAARSEFPAAE